MFVWVTFGSGDVPKAMFNMNVTCNILCDAMKNTCLKAVEEYSRGKDQEIKQAIASLEEEQNSLEQHIAADQAEAAETGGEYTEDQWQTDEKVRLADVMEKRQAQLTALQEGVAKFKGKPHIAVGMFFRW
jgi:hypothetical protein